MLSHPAEAMEPDPPNDDSSLPGSVAGPERREIASDLTGMDMSTKPSASRGHATNRQILVDLEGTLAVRLDGLGAPSEPDINRPRTLRLARALWCLVRHRAISYRRDGRGWRHRTRFILEALEAEN